MNFARVMVTVVAVLIGTQCNGSNITELDCPTQATIEPYTDQTNANGNAVSAESEPTTADTKRIPSPQKLVETELTQMRTSIAQSAKERSLTAWKTIAPQLKTHMATRNIDQGEVYKAM